MKYYRIYETLVNTSKLLILSLLLVLCSFQLISSSYASVESEAQEDILAGCRDNQTLVYRFAYKDYICLEPSTADRWKELGFAEIIQENPQSTKEINKTETTEFIGSPPPPPQRSLSDVTADCRPGFTLVHRITYDDLYCIDSITAITWERLGLSEMIKTDQLTDGKIPVSEDVVDDSLKETELISESNDKVSNDKVSNDKVSNDKVSNDKVSNDEDYQNYETAAFVLSEKLNFLYSPKINQINDRIWIAVGYNITNTVLIEADRGIIVIDTPGSYESSKKILEEFRTITDKPVITIIYTNINPNLVDGSKAFLEEGDGDVEIIINEEQLEYYIDEYNSDEYDLAEYGLIPQVTHTFSSEFSLNISGVKMNLFHSGDDDRVGGYYSAQTYISFPDDDAVLIGDSVYGISPYILDVDYLQNFFN